VGKGRGSSGSFAHQGSSATALLGSRSSSFDDDFGKYALTVGQPPHRARLRDHRGLSPSCPSRRRHMPASSQTARPASGVSSTGSSGAACRRRPGGQVGGDVCGARCPRGERKVLEAGGSAEDEKRVQSGRVGARDVGVQPVAAHQRLRPLGAEPTARQVEEGRTRLADHVRARWSPSARPRPTRRCPVPARAPSAA
jgi:hypothetical protein